MKKLLIILFSILISFNSYGLFEKTVCVETDTQDRNGVIYLPNKTKPFSGKNLCKYENGQNKSQGTVKKGVNHEKWIRWYENGQIKSELNYKDGKFDGKQTDWYENGQKFDEGTYKNAMLEGKNTQWYENGNKKSEMNYKNGKLEGRQEFWFDEDGLTGLIMHYANGNKVSEESTKTTIERWKENGQKSIVIKYINGIKHEQNMWNPSGTKFGQFFYKDDEIVRALWYENDQLDREFNDGVCSGNC